MKKVFFTFLLTLLVSCGRAPGDGKPGEDGEDGGSATCQIIERNGKQYFSCKNPDGSLAEVEVKPGEAGQPGAPGKPGLPAVEYSVSCKLFWANEGNANAGQDISFNVIFLSEGSSLASLHTFYRSGSQFEFVQTTTAYWAKASGMAEKALVENTIWKVELLSNSSAKIFRKGVNQERNASCSQD